MNLKSIHRNYEHLTMLERLSLADKAVSRGDKSEIKAVVAASPRQTYSQPDYLDLLENINRLRFCNLIVRLSYVMQFDYFFQCDFEGDERISNNAKVAAYLYVRATDAWKAVSDEFGLRPDYNQEICALLYSVEMLNRKD